MSALDFSVERPFGFYLFDYFDQLYTIVVGQSAKDFHFVQGVTPLSTLHEGKFIKVRAMGRVIMACSDHWLHYLLYCHLWRSVPSLQRVACQMQNAQPNP